MRDFKHIKWENTLCLNFFHALFASPVWTVVMMAGEEPFSVAGKYLKFPLFYFVGTLPLGLVAVYLAGLGVPYAGFSTPLGKNNLAILFVFALILPTLKKLFPIIFYMERIGHEVSLLCRGNPR